MFQRAISLDQFARLYEGLDVRGRTDTGFALTIIGVHNLLGTCIVIQDVAADMILHSEAGPFEMLECTLA